MTTPALNKEKINEFVTLLNSLYLHTESWDLFINKAFELAITHWKFSLNHPNLKRMFNFNVEIGLGYTIENIYELMDLDDEVRNIIVDFFDKLRRIQEGEVLDNYVYEKYTDFNKINKKGDKPLLYVISSEWKSDLDRVYVNVELKDNIDFSTFKINNQNDLDLISKSVLYEYAILGKEWFDKLIEDIRKSIIALGDSIYNYLDKEVYQNYENIFEWKKNRF